MKKWVGEVKLKNGDILSFFFESENLLKAYSYAKEEGQKISRDSITVAIHEIDG